MLSVASERLRNLRLRDHLCGRDPRVQGSLAMSGLGRISRCVCPLSRLVNLTMRDVEVTFQNYTETT
jgi:hypothetical protein